MSAQATAKAADPEDDSTMASPGGDKPNLAARLRIWRQVIIAEILNLLEKRRYDACK